MIQILLLFAFCLASTIAEAQVPSSQLPRPESTDGNSNLTARIVPIHHFVPRHLPPVNTLPQIPMPRTQMFHPILQTPSIARASAFPIILSPNLNASFSSVPQGMVLTNAVHFNPNNPAAVTASNTVMPGVPVIPVPGIPSKLAVHPGKELATSKIRDMDAEDLLQLTQPTGAKDKALLKDISPNGAASTLAMGSNPGQCPVRQCTSQHLAQQMRMCNSDLNCLATEKCCMDPCWRVLSCSPAVPQPSAQVCPPQTPCTDRTFKVVCSSDRECSAAIGSKCCMDQCLGMWVCKHPVSGSTTGNPSPWLPPVPPYLPPVPPYLPPVPPYLPPAPPAPNKCKVFCPGSLECCDSVSHVGYCPASSLCYSLSQAQALPHKFTPCSVDQQCQTSEKCCISRCHNRMVCLPSVENTYEHPGTCPAASACDQHAENNLAECTDDRQCYLFERCCRSSCSYGRSLCKSTSGHSPNTNTSLPGFQCTTPCPGSSYCCDSETKPGFCPKTRQCPGSTIPSPRCTSDRNCNGDKKCCVNSCTGDNQCTDAVSDPNEHPGFCPVPNCSAAVPPIGKVNQCRIDTDCFMHEKCCPDCSQNYNCEKSLSSPKCRLPCPGNKATCCDGKEKDGFCPAQEGCTSGPLGSSKICDEDYECRDSSKCCHDACRGRKICKQPDSTTSGGHSGVCPTIPCDAGSSKFICHQDSECQFHQRCCPASSGKNECLATNCTRQVTAQAAPHSYASPGYQAHPSPPNSYPSFQNPFPPSVHTNVPPSNKYPPPSALAPPPSALAPRFPPTTGSGASPHPLTNVRVPPQNSLPSLPQRLSLGSANYPAASQPLSNRYTWPNSHGYRPQIPLPQTSELMQPSPGRYVAPRPKQRSKYYQPPQPFYANSKFE